MAPGHARGIPLYPSDLFDADYEDCPSQTCLRDGKIANLDATRDLTDADVVHVTWEVTDATIWDWVPTPSKVHRWSSSSKVVGVPRATAPVLMEKLFQ